MYITRLMSRNVETRQRMELRLKPVYSAYEEQLLGCISCKWLGAERQGKFPQVSAAEIAECTGNRVGPIADALQLLSLARITRIMRLPSGAYATDPTQTPYGPDDTRGAMRFWNEMERQSHPETCRLEATQL
jgi:hypothetical protein